MLARAQFLRANKVLVATSCTPHLNFAQELELLLSPPADDKILYLWRSTPSVSIGRHQNPYKECDLEYMKNNKVALLRRTNGGGATYQDLNFTNWAFVGRRPDQRNSVDLVLSALRALGVSTRAGRVENQIMRPTLIQTPTSALFRGTFQFNVGPVLGKRCLRDEHFPAMKLIEKGITHDMFCDALVQAFREYSDDCQVRYLDGKAMLANGGVNERFKELTSQEWLFGKSSAEQNMISRNFAFGRFDVAFRFEGQKVKKALVHSDCQVPEIVEKFEDCINLVGRSRLPQSLSQRIYLPPVRNEQEREMTQQLVSWIMPEIKKVEFHR
jgi:lipoate-protein ligase A